MTPSERERLITEAEAYASDGEPLPANLISDLMAEGIDHTQFTNVPLDRDETNRDS